MSSYAARYRLTKSQQTTRPTDPPSWQRDGVEYVVSSMPRQDWHFAALDALTEPEWGADAAQWASPRLGAATVEDVIYTGIKAKAVMTKPQIENKMTIGNILNLLALVVAVAVGWGVMSERGESTRSELTDIKETLRQEVSTRREGQGALEARIRALESSQARADERFNSVLQVLGRIEARLERIEGR